MMKFDIQTVAPDGYEVIGYRMVSPSELIRNPYGEAVPWVQTSSSTSEYIVLKRLRWTPKLGETYYTIRMSSTGFFGPQQSSWDCGAVDVTRRDRGIVFQTTEGAEGAADKLNEALKAVFEELADED